MSSISKIKDQVKSGLEQVVKTKEVQEFKTKYTGPGGVFDTLFNTLFSDADTLKNKAIDHTKEKTSLNRLYIYIKNKIFNREKV